MEQRSVIKFLVAKGLTQAATFKELQAVFGENCMGHTQVHHWWVKFSEGNGHTPTEDMEHPGHPKERNKWITQIQQLLQQDSRLTI